MHVQDFARWGYILECIEYLRHNLMCFVIQVIILVALVVYQKGGGGYNGCGFRGGHIDKIMGCSTPLKWQSENVRITRT